MTRGARFRATRAPQPYDLVPADPFDGPVLACEGELDALCALSNGFNAVAGTAGAGTFKDKWAAYLARLAPAQDHSVVVAFDGDETGREGAQTAAQRLHEASLEVRVASLPMGWT
jgi:putative DNA primase/helicase